MRGRALVLGALLTGLLSLMATVCPAEALVAPRPDDDGRLVMAGLRSRCIKCHGPKRAKGGLRLDRAEGILASVRPGEAPASALFRRVTLPEGHRDAMPPKGARLDDAAILALMRWINAGAAPEELGLDDAPTDGDADAAARRLDALAAATGAFVARVPSDEGADLRLDFSRSAKSPDEATAAALTPVAGRIVALSFAGRPLQKAFVEALPPLPGLRHLGLQRTGCDDAILEVLLERAPRVRRLNLHATRVTASSLRRLSALDSLRRLVLHETPLDSRRVREFAARHPRVKVTGSLGLPAEPFPAGGPRRILVADASRSRLVMLRETALNHLDLVWERESGGKEAMDEAFAHRPPGTARGPSGATFLCARGGREVLEMSKEGKVGFRLSAEDLDRFGISAVSDLQVLSDGNLVLAARNAGEKGPHLVEVTREKKVVWRIHAPRRLGARLERLRVFEDPRRHE